MRSVELVHCCKVQRQYTTGRGRGCQGCCADIMRSHGPLTDTSISDHAAAAAPDFPNYKEKHLTDYGIIKRHGLLTDTSTSDHHLTSGGSVIWPEIEQLLRNFRPNDSDSRTAVDHQDSGGSAMPLPL